MKFSKVDWITFIITYINAKDRKRRVTLKTLKVLKIRTDLKALTAFPLPPESRVNSKIESMTMAPSNMFILSLK